MENEKNPLAVGKSVFIRTVTHYYTGKIIELTATEIVLEEAAWVADTGRFHEALAKGTLNEVEPFPGVVAVGRGAMVDVAEWSHELPRKAK